MAGAGITVGFGLGVIFLIMLMVAVGVLAFIFWIFMVVDCAKRNFRKDSEKIAWILVLVLASSIGALIYYFAVKRRA